MYTVGSTEDVIAEVVYSLRREKPEAAGSLTSRVHDIIVASLDFRVDDFPSGTSGFPGMDRDDIHVHAAAVADGANILLTADNGFHNLEDSVIDQLPYEL